MAKHLRRGLKDAKVRREEVGDIDPLGSLRWKRASDPGSDGASVLERESCQQRSKLTRHADTSICHLSACAWGLAPLGVVVSFSVGFISLERALDSRRSAVFGLLVFVREAVYRPFNFFSSSLRGFR